MKKLFVLLLLFCSFYLKAQQNNGEYEKKARFSDNSEINYTILETRPEKFPRHTVYILGATGYSYFMPRRFFAKVTGTILGYPTGLNADAIVYVISSDDITKMKRITLASSGSSNFKTRYSVKEEITKKISYGVHLNYNYYFDLKNFGLHNNQYAFGIALTPFKFLELKDDWHRKPKRHEYTRRYLARTNYCLDVIYYFKTALDNDNHLISKSGIGAQLYMDGVNQFFLYRLGVGYTDKVYPIASVGISLAF